MRKNITTVQVILLLVIFSISLISCDHEENDGQFLEELEDAQTVAISLDSLKKALLNEVTNDSYQSFIVYPVSLVINGTNAGNATLVGSDTVSGAGGHTGGYISKRANVNFELDSYSNSNSVVLANGGHMNYRNLHVVRSSYCTDRVSVPAKMLKIRWKLLRRD